MIFAKFKQFVFQSKTGKVIGSAYLLYIAVLMVTSAQVGMQLGTELRSVPQDLRMEYISSFLSKNF